MSKKHSPNEFASVIQFFRLAVAKMRALSIPLTAQNYTVWYEYFNNSEPALNQEIEALLKAEQSFTSELNFELYSRFFEAKSSTQLNKMRLAISNLIRHLSLQMASLVEDMDNYDSALATCESQLHPTADVDTLSKLIATLIEETHKARSASQSTATLVKELNSEIESMRSVMAELNEENLVDALTGIGNRRAFDRALADSLTKSQRDQRQFCLLMIDIDHFKRFNDSYGHLAGDSVLRYVARRIKKGTKGQDFVCRYGGEEFSIILPNTDYHGGLVVAQAIADKVSKRILSAGKDSRPMGRVTLSVGVAISRLGDDAEILIGRADDCLYRAKAGGRNRVLGERE